MGQESPQDLWIEKVLLLQNTICKILRRITGQDGHLTLPQNRASIQLWHNLMHRASRKRVTGRQGALMGVEPLILWQKRRMNIEHPPPPSADKLRAQNSHEPCQAYHINLIGH